VKKFMMFEDRNVCCMLPPPLNIFTVLAFLPHTLISILEFRRRVRRRKMARSVVGKKSETVEIRRYRKKKKNRKLQSTDMRTNIVMTSFVGTFSDYVLRSLELLLDVLVN